MAVDVTINIRLFVANFSGKSREMILFFQILNLFFFAKIIFLLFQWILVKSLCSVDQKCYCKMVWLYRWYSKVPNEALSSQTTLICQWETMNRVSFTAWNVEQVFGSLCLKHHTFHPLLLYFILWVWHIEGENVQIVTDFIFLSSKITADSDCSNEIKRHLLLGRKAMTNLDSILKRRDITLPTNVRRVKTIVFPVVMYRYESWTVWRPSAQELMPLNCGAREDSLGL